MSNKPSNKPVSILTRAAEVVGQAISRLYEMILKILGGTRPGGGRGPRR